MLSVSKASREQVLVNELKSLKQELAAVKAQARHEIFVRERGELLNPADMSISSIPSGVDSSKMYTPLLTPQADIAWSIVAEISTLFMCSTER